MVVDRQMIFWTLILLVFIFLLWLWSSILLPFVAGIALAYIQVPLVDRLEQFGMNRTMAALLLVGVITLTIILLVLLLLPILLRQSQAFLASIPGYLGQLRALLADSASPWLNQMFSGDINKVLPEVANRSGGYLTGFVSSLWSGGKALVSFISLIVVVPVVAFYLTCDWHRMIDTLDTWVPRHHYAPVHQIVGEIDAATSGFLRGQAGICLIVGVFYAIAFSMFGLNFALFIGLFAGLLYFVPYIGTAIGFLIAVSVAVQQFWPQWIPIAIVAGVFLVGQFVAAYVLSPKLIGHHVGLHPVWLIFAMFAFGYLFGFFGLLIAVPLAAAIGVLFRFALNRYFDTPLYRGGKSG